MKRSEKLIHTIRENDIRPVARVYFLWRTILLWVAFTAAVVLGALAFSVILFCIQQTDFDLVSHLSHSQLEFFLGILPFVWIIFLIVFLIIAMTSFRHSPKGYKLTRGRLVAYCAALSILTGALVFLAGGGQWLEQAFGTRISLYESVQEKKVKLWSMPGAGYLSGVITAAGDSTLTLRDFKGKTWAIDVSGAFIAPVLRLEAGEKIKLVGETAGENQFKAGEVRPWGGRGARMRGPIHGY
ncbi:MAG: hypothetical protein IPH12_13335 [Saprospirales bacterium]|nr:hypothetical protein [Saprospirales bacterium]